MADDVTINIRTRGGRQSAREAQAAATGIAQIGREARTVGRNLRDLSSRATSRGFQVIGNQAKYAGLAITGLAAVGVRAGIQFNASMEQSETAFTGLLGSRRAAIEELAFLQKTAASTPFELPQITDAARKFLAFGFSVKRTNSLLATTGDAIAGAGIGAEEMQRVILALGQIRGKGTLQMEELRQLQELGLINPDKLAKNLGMTSAELQDVGEQGVTADRAIRAIQKTLDDTFGGQAAKQAKTFNGQVSTLRDNLNKTLGTVTKPGFDLLRDRVFPKLNASAGSIEEIFGRDDIDLAEKITLSRGVLRKNLGPLMDEAGRELGELHLGQKALDGFEAAVPRIAEAAGRAAPKIAGAMVRGFLNAGPYGQMFAIGVIAAKLGAFRAAGALAAGAFMRSFRKNTGPIPAPGGGVTPPVVVPGGGSRGKGKGGPLRRIGGKALRAVPVIGTGVVAGELAYEGLRALGVGGGKAKPLSADARRDQRARAVADAERRGNVLPKQQRPRAVARPVRDRPTIVHTSVKVDGREIAKAVHRAEADKKATR